MDRTISWPPSAGAQDPLDRALIEIDAAIALVVEAAEHAAFTGATWAQTAGVAFRLLRDPPSSTSLVVGPRLRAVSAETNVETES